MPEHKAGDLLQVNDGGFVRVINPHWPMGDGPFCERADDEDFVPGALAQRFKDERNIARTEIDAVIETALSAGIPRVVDGWERGANDLVAELVAQNDHYKTLSASLKAELEHYREPMA